jgi:hypothetical protein
MGRSPWPRAPGIATLALFALAIFIFPAARD